MAQPDSGISPADFNALKNKVINYHNENDEDKEDMKNRQNAMKDKQLNHDQRLNDIEGQIKLLRMMNRPPGEEGDGGPDLLDALQDIKNDLRK